jgi:GAF domain-containing protein
MTKTSDYFKTFCKVSKALGATLGRKELLDLIVTSAIETMNGKAACLFLADEREDVFVPVAQSGLSDNYLHASPFKAKRVVDSILKGGYLAFSDATSDPRLEHHEAKKAEGIASILTVPVTLHDKAVGVLSLYTASRREFSHEEIDFLKALADQGGVAIENARLVERIRKNSLLFLDLASSINASLDVRQILHILTADVCEALEMKGVALRLLNQNRGTLDLVASYGLSEEFLNKGPVTAEKSMMKALEGETVVISDVRTDDRIQYPDAVAKEGIVSMIVVPIKSRDEVIGVMRLCSDIAQDYHEDMLLLVNAIAHQGALAIQNASMHAMLEEDIRDLKEDTWSHRSWF